MVYNLGTVYIYNWLVVLTILKNITRYFTLFGGPRGCRTTSRPALCPSSDRLCGIQQGHVIRRDNLAPHLGKHNGVNLVHLLFRPT